MNGVDMTAMAAASGASDRMLTIGLVNNMPAGARAATERQFRQLLTAAAGDRTVRLRCYGNGAAAAAAGYADVETIFESEIDGVIVTGAEPQAARLPDEPLWPTITRLVDWADRHAIPSIWSCLAAHAAVHYLDGVGRRPLAEKLSGVFSGEIVADHPLTRRLGRDWKVPHSRCNDLDEDALRASGYSILVRSDEAGVDMFQKTMNAPFIFFQSHPEYDADTLLREFHRDVRRYHLGERPRLPAAPRHYFQPERQALFDALCEATPEAGRNAEKVLELLGRADRDPTPAPWLPTAVTIYGNWIEDLSRRKDESPALPWMLEALAVHHQQPVETGATP
jgi:homoserine O-succinyltransferase